MSETEKYSPFSALDVESFGDPQGFDGPLHELVAQAMNSSRASEVNCLPLPGQLETERFAAAGHGVPIDDSTLADIRNAAALVSASLLKDD